MIYKNKKNILVIGSRGHSLAEKCVDWGENVYIGDHDFIIVDTTTLSEELLRTIAEEEPKYLTNLRKQIVEVQLKKSLDIVCITSKFVSLDASNAFDLLRGDSEPTINNYSWCPIIPIFEETPGEKIDKKSLKINLKYLNLLRGWERLYNFYFNNSRRPFGYESDYYFEAKEKDILLNELGRTIVIELDWAVYDRYKNYKYGSEGSILFLPEIDNTKTGIDLLLEDFVKVEEVIPEWIKGICLPDEPKMLQRIEGINEKIKELNEEKNVIELDAEKLNEYKKLLYSTGVNLEDIVEKSLEFLGVTVQRVGDGYNEDRIFNDEDAKIPIEIRGKNAGLNETDLNQLISRFADKPISRKYQTRGIFVLNHFRGLRPEDREEPFHHNISEKAKTWSIGLIKSETIFNFVKMKLSGAEMADLKEKLFNTIGIFNL